MNLLSHHVVNMKIFLNITIQDVLSPSVCPMPPYMWNPRKSVHTFTKRDMPHSRINQQKDTHWRAPQRTATHCNTFTHSRTIRRTRSGCATTHHNALQRTSTHWATHCHALQHTATQSLVHEKSEGHALTRTTTHCNTLQHIVTHCNTLQHRNASHWNTLQHTHSSTNHQDDTYCMHCNTLQRTATHCNTGLQCTATHCNALQHTRSSTNHQQDTHELQCTAMHCNTLQHTATHSNTLTHSRTIRRTRIVCTGVVLYDFEFHYVGPAHLRTCRSSLRLWSCLLRYVLIFLTVSTAHLQILCQSGFPTTQKYHNYIANKYNWNINFVPQVLCWFAQVCMCECLCVFMYVHMHINFGNWFPTLLSSCLLRHICCESWVE